MLIALFLFLLIKKGEREERQLVEVAVLFYSIVMEKSSHKQNIYCTHMFI